MKLSLESTKALQTYQKRGENSKVYADIIEAARNCDKIPEEDVIPFALKIGNHILNGGLPAGFPQFRNTVDVALDAKIVRRIVCENVYEFYSRTRKSTLDRWRIAIKNLK